MNPPPTKPWDSPRLQNNAQVLRNDGYNMGPSSAPNGMLRSVPVLPPRPQNSVMGVNSGGYSTYGGYNSYSMPYSSYGYGSYGSLPYRSSLYGNCGYGMYNMGGFPTYATNANGEAERRFVQYAEQQSRSTFANIENIVQAVSSFALMLDNTFFAMTSSFRAVLSVAEHFGRLRSVFGHIWYTINVFRLFNWFYKKFLQLLGKRVPSGGSSSLAWKEAASGGAAAAATTTVNQGANVGSNFSTLAFLGLIISTPYLVSKFLPKYEDNSDPTTWKSPGVAARAAFNFTATAPNELSLQTNEDIILAPTYIQEEMKLVNTGWAYAVSARGGKSGLVPLNYLVLSGGGGGTRSNSNVPIPRDGNNKQVLPLKSSLKRVSFGENQVMDIGDVDKKLMGSVENAGDRNNNEKEDGGGS